ncbi:hypothetical protein ACQ3I4_09590 [Zafaria sp. Z1313]|uniref:hypothetical protein n=1 Tax=unclassified Zafaria TaxID=2828765 RepID=UPI002E7A87DE|nr:hypothetical protein [Zafaria sp. J156]MEE1621829.1 hypothetical protein [Zafaria sp. J156]
MTQWSINVESARKVVKDSRDAFDDLDGIEGKIRAAGGECADAAVEEKIFEALNDCYDRALRPLSVTMVKAGRQAFDGTDAVIDAVVESDIDMGDAWDRELVRSVEKTAQGIDDTPGYTPGESTDTSPVATQTQDPSNPDRNSDGSYRL